MKFANLIKITVLTLITCYILSNESYPRSAPTYYNSNAQRKMVKASELRRNGTEEIVNNDNVYVSCNYEGCPEVQAMEEREKNKTINKLIEDTFKIPKEYRSENPIEYNGVPNFNEKLSFFNMRDDFNPNNHKELSFEYPVYDVLPGVNHFTEGTVKAKVRKAQNDSKDSKKRTVSKENIIELLHKELKDLKVDIFGDSKSSVKSRISDKVYNSMWLKYQLGVNRILELEALINSKTHSKK